MSLGSQGAPPDAAGGVSVIIAAFNAAATVARAVRSALAQAEAAQVFVVDDASADDTASQAEQADDGSGRLHVFRQTMNAGPSASRNRALAHATGDWVTVLDADDYFLPGRLAALLARAGAADLVADDLLRVFEGREAEPPTPVFSSAPFEPHPIDLAGFVSGNISRKGRDRAELGFIKPLMRRSFLDAHALRYQESMRLGEDYELYARALALGAKLSFGPQTGYVSVVRPSSLSGRHTEADLQSLRDCDLALAALPGLTVGERRTLGQHARSVDARLQWRLLINAVKARDPVAAVQTFLRPWPVPQVLLANLLDEAVARGRRRAAMTLA
jgi:succinoglycan biosynthesis protein ExoU